MTSLIEASVPTIDGDERSGRWPTGGEYADAVVRRAVDVDELGQRWTHRESFLGLPASAHGRHAIVFPLRKPDGSEVALRCFTAAPPDIAVRHREVAEHLHRHPVRAVVATTWHAEAIVVDGRRFPVVTSQWVEGQHLDRWIDDVLVGSDAAARCRLLARRWRAAVLDLGAARVAHGDLQHGNVVVGPGDILRLVDLDGSWVPTLHHQPSDELGLPGYQRSNPAGRGRPWGPELDAIPALVIWLTLLALAADPSLWHLHREGDEHLVLDEFDLADVSRPIWSQLARSPDAEVRELVDRLRRLLVSADRDPRTHLALGRPSSPSLALAD